MEEDDTTIDQFEAKSSVHYILITQMMAEICLMSSDPMKEAKDKAARLLGALEHAADAKIASEWFNHFAIDEMETFWKRVYKEIDYRIGRTGNLSSINGGAPVSDPDYRAMQDIAEDRANQPVR